MKSIQIIAFLAAFCFLTGFVNAQTKSKETKCTGEDECCKKATDKKTTNINTSNMITAVKKEKEVACKLTSPELQKRKTEVITLLKANVIERKEITNGYQYTFKGSDKMLDDLVSFIKAERACCGFFTFKLSVEDVDTNIILTMTGPEGAKEFINAEMEL